MKAIQIYNPLTAFANTELIKLLKLKQLEIERKKNPCHVCRGKCEIKGVCEECYGTGEAINVCDDCDGTGIEKND